ncbi:MAG TPA: HNH endonuclease [Lutibacter sp.]|nr:HNH endonuclease [Lutibacter sp.]
MEIKDKFNEIWKPYKREQDNWKDSQKYLVSNYGRVISMKTGTPHLLKLVKTSNFPVVTSIQCKDGKSRSFYVHHAVAELFLEKRTEEQKRIIHFDFDKENNVFSNLKYVTMVEWWAHYKKSPKVQLANKKRRNSKLNEKKVALLKKRLFDPNRKTRIKMLAKQFGISEMQVWRIKSGENWGNVEPAK